MAKTIKIPAVTQWFNCLTFDPEHQGSYEVEFRNRDKVIKVAKVAWKDGHWAFHESMRPSGAMGDRWRGLAEKPKQ